MKKIINGKMYNTDTAKELAGWSSPGGRGDFSHYEETLYQKRTGEFLLHYTTFCQMIQSLFPGSISWVVFTAFFLCFIGFSLAKI